MRIAVPLCLRLSASEVNQVVILYKNIIFKLFCQKRLDSLTRRLKQCKIPKGSKLRQERTGSQKRPMRKYIVVIDDDKETREIVTFAFTHNGFDVAAASGGAQLQELLEVRLPDLIILDVIMPGQDGYQIFYRLRNDPQTQHIPVIIMTAHAENIYARITLDLGATHVTKPFHPLALVEIVKSLLPG
jgi:CheY-like chemotaxis protein